MTRIVVADAGPLIGMARIGQLSLIQNTYGSIIYKIPSIIRSYP